MKRTAIIFIGGVLLASCGSITQPENPTVVANEKTQSGSTDYKEMFGPDYQRGDIGHSTGNIANAMLTPNQITIAHGTIHGIDRGADTTTFDVPEGVSVPSVSAGGKVEFLVKKGDDDVYRLFKICNLPEDGKSCL